MSFSPQKSFKKGFIQSHKVGEFKYWQQNANTHQERPSHIATHNHHFNNAQPSHIVTHNRMIDASAITEIDSEPTKFFFGIYIILAMLFVLMAVLIPYFMSDLFVNEQFCDNNETFVSGNNDTYFVFTHLRNTCVKCPDNAQCENGIAKCDENRCLDKYVNICLKKGDKTGILASEIANKVYKFLGHKMGKYECNASSVKEYSFDKQSIQKAIFGGTMNETMEFVFDYAMSHIVKNGYSDKIGLDSQTQKYKSFKPIPDSAYCKALYFKKQYLHNKVIELDVISCLSLIALIGVVIVLKELRRNGSNTAME